MTWQIPHHTPTEIHTSDGTYIATAATEEIAARIVGMAEANERLRESAYADGWVAGATKAKTVLADLLLNHATLFKDQAVTDAFREYGQKFHRTVADYVRDASAPDGKDAG